MTQIHPEELLCPISYEIMANPVILEDGHTYDKYYITKALKIKQISPMTGLPISNKFIPNRTLKNIIDKYCLTNNITLPIYIENNEEHNKFEYVISINDIYNNITLESQNSIEISSNVDSDNDYFDNDYFDSDYDSDYFDDDSDSDITINDNTMPTLDIISFRELLNNF